MAEADIPIVNNVLCTTVLLILEIADAWIIVLADNAVKVIGRSIIDNDNLIVLVGLCQNAVDGLLQIPVLIGRNGYTEFDLFRHTNRFFCKNSKYLLDIQTIRRFFT